MEALRPRSFPRREDESPFEEEEYVRPLEEEAPPEHHGPIQGQGLTEVTVPAVNMGDPAIRKGFSLKERMQVFFGSAGRVCSNSEKTYFTRGYTSDCMKSEAAAINDRSSDITTQFRHKVLYLKIYDTNGLTLDPNVIHPFVKVHIIDLVTGTYLAKTSTHNVLHTHEHIGQLDRSVYFSGVSPFLLPFSTPPFDMRIKGENDPHWDQEFILDEAAEYILNPNVVFLFEILDFNFKLVRERSKQLRKDKMYPIAWAFFRPIGQSGIHLGVTKLQLYKYKFTPPPNFRQNRRPFVFFDYNWQSKDLYPSFLRVEMRAEYPPERRIVTYPPRSVFEIERGYFSWEQLYEDAGHPRKLRAAEVAEKGEEERLREIRLSSWRRYHGEPCQVPFTLAFKLDTCKLGCWRLAFSNEGKHLAVACTDDSTVIKIYEVEDGKLVTTLRGHSDIIHDLDWSQNDDYLLSSSSDGTAKLWKLDRVLKEENLMMSSQMISRDNLFLVATLQHISYVYSGKFHPDQTHLYEKLVMATASFDGNIGFWVFQGDEAVRLHEIPVIPSKKLDYNYLKEQHMSNKEKEMIENSHPNTLRFDDRGLLYIGDSQGVIYIYSVNIRNDTLEATHIRDIELDELAGDPINHIMLQPREQKHLLVQSRDNVLRRIEPVSHDTQYDLVDTRFFSAKIQKYNVRSTVSPDGKFLLTGSEDGKVHMWDISTGFYVDLKHWEVNVKELISDVSWNNRFNMVAVAGFGSELPVLVYVHEKSKEELEKALTHANFAHEEEARLAPYNEYISDFAQEHRQLPSRF